MSKGVDAVKAAIIDDFNPPTIHGEPFETDDTVLTFEAEGRSFSVTVSWQFDQDYPDVRYRFDPKRLCRTLRVKGSARVTEAGA